MCVCGCGTASVCVCALPQEGSEADKKGCNNDEQGRHHLPSSKWGQRKSGEGGGGGFM